MQLYPCQAVKPHAQIGVSGSTAPAKARGSRRGSTSRRSTRSGYRRPPADHPGACWKQASVRTPRTVRCWAVRGSTATSASTGHGGLPDPPGPASGAPRRRSPWRRCPARSRGGGIVEVPEGHGGRPARDSSSSHGRIQPGTAGEHGEAAALHLGRDLSAPLGRARLRPRPSRRFSTAT
jgi:hypothetical protein